MGGGGEHERRVVSGSLRTLDYARRQRRLLVARDYESTFGKGGSVGAQPAPRTLDSKQPQKMKPVEVCRSRERQAQTMRLKNPKESEESLPGVLSFS